MAMGKTKDAPDPLLVVAQQLERIARQIDVGLKLFLKEKQGDRPDRVMIRQLGALGYGAADIATWLRLPKTTVAPELSKMKVEGNRGSQEKASLRKKR